MIARPAPITAAPADSLAFLDGLRGLAAVWVMLHHARWLLWEGWGAYVSHAGEYSIFGRALTYLLSPLRYGHEAVIFFFILSGFVIHLGYARRLVSSPEQATFGWLSYVARRARRLYPPLLLALGLTFLLDSACQFLVPPPAEEPTVSLVVAATDHRPVTLLGNLAFLMGTWVPPYGTNGPLWSLHFEWWFYMIYPLLWLAARRSLAGATGLVLVAFAVSWLPSSGAIFFIAQIFKGLLIWWLGALLAEIYVGRWRVSWARLVPLVFLLPALPLLLPRLAARWPAFGPGWVSDVLYGFGFAGLFAACFWWRERGGSLWILERLRVLGEMSYTLYVTHLPVLALMSCWLLVSKGRLPDHYGWLPVGAAVCLLLAWGAHFLVERPFVRRKPAS